MKYLWTLFFLGVVLFFSSCSDDDDICVPDLTLRVDSSEVTMIAADHYAVYTEVIINASAEETWEVLTDFANMPNWSSTFQGLSGDIRDGGQVVANFLVQGDLLGFPHTLRFIDGVEFGWSDPIIGFDGIVDNHIYRVEAISDCQSRFIQTDEFRGSNPNVTLGDFAGLTIQSYQLFNQELKAEVEQ